MSPEQLAINLYPDGKLPIGLTAQEVISTMENWDIVDHRHWFEIQIRLLQPFIKAAPHKQ